MGQDENPSIEKLSQLQADLTKLLRPKPETDQEAIYQVYQSLKAAEQNLTDGSVIKTQAALEDALGQLLVTLKRFGLDADKALSRLQTRWSKTEQKRFVVYPDYVEIWVGAEFRGGWALYTADDTTQALRLANELHCQVTFADTRQLALFQ